MNDKKDLMDAEKTAQEKENFSAGRTDGSANKKNESADKPSAARAANASRKKAKSSAAGSAKPSRKKADSSAGRTKASAREKAEESAKPAPPERVQDYVRQKLEESSAEKTADQNSQMNGGIDIARIKKDFRKKGAAVNDSQVRRYAPDLNAGLSSAQVNERFSQFLFNDTNQKFSKSYASIFVGNLCTFFNLLCVLAAAALAYSGAPLSQYFFVAIFTLNLCFGIAVEIRAKKKIDKLSLLTVPTAQVIRDGKQTEIHAKDIVLDDIVCLALGNQIPADCIVAEGAVEVNEALLTGESVPVKKETGDFLYAGSFISSGSCKARADKVGKNTYLNSLSAKAKKYKKPNSELMRSTKLIIYVIGILIIPIAIFMFFVNRHYFTDMSEVIQRTVSVVIGMIPSGMLLLTSVALTLGIIRLMAQNTLVQDLYSLEMLARVNVLCLDKTGTITDGRMKVNDCMLLSNPTDFTINEIVGSCLNALQDNNQTAIALYNYFGYNTALTATATMPFSSKRKLSAASFDEIGTVAIGAPEFVLSTVPDKINKIINQYASMGLRVMVAAIASGKIVGDKLPGGFKPIAIISIADNIREDAPQTIRWFKENDVAIKIISGDNPVTVSEVAKRVGVANAEKYISLEGMNESEVASVADKYTVFGRVTPEQKAILVKSIKSAGNTVAMTGDGVNDILAMKEADCAVSVASGSEAAKNVSHIVLLDNNFASMPKVVFEGRRVINNIQNSSAMYLMKTFFTAIFALISIITWQAYPFYTSSLMLMEVFVIGVPTFFLSLQPNKDRVQGKFLSTVLSRAIPCAIVLVLGVQSTRFINAWFPGHIGDTLEELSVIIITFAGLVMLYRICLPLNLYRGVLILVMLAGCVLGITLFPRQIFGEAYVSPNFVSVLYALVVILLSFPLSDAMIKIFDKLRSSRRTEEQRIFLHK